MSGPGMRWVVDGRAAWPLLAMWVALSATAVVLELASGDVVDAALSPLLGVLAGVGALLVRRRPDNPIGWVLLALALLVTLGAVLDALSPDSAGTGLPSLRTQWVVWFGEWSIYLWFGLVGIVLPLLFPDGHLPSPRWRPLAYAGAGVIGVKVLATAFAVPRFDWGEGEGTSMRNPAAIDGPVATVLDLAGDAAGFAFLPVLVGALAAVASRFRRSTGVERQQLKWFAYSIGLLLAGLAAALLGELFDLILLGTVGWMSFLGAMIIGMPIAIGIAILRHRLYDVDMVIKRTLVYGSLTALLVATYLGLVLLFRLALSPLVGESDLAVAASTLTVAALFRPMRSRIQAEVDRRFFRARYDAGRTLDAFGSRLRSELDLEALGWDLRRAVEDTMQPAHVSLWLREVRR